MADEKALNEQKSLMAAVSRKSRDSNEANNGGILIRTLVIRIAIVLGVAVSWACATQFTKSALNIDQRRFFAPYSLVWFNTCFMSICYAVFLVYTTTIEKKTIKAANKHAFLLFSETGGLGALNLFKRVFPFLVLWTVANYSFSQSLGRISAAAASSIMSTNTAMVCILSVILINERLTVERILAVFLAIGGVTIVSLDREFAGNWIGIILVVFSALTAALYKTLFKKSNGHGTLGQVSLFMTCLGLMNLFINIIPVAILIALDVDHVEWEAIPWIPLAGSALLGLLYNFLVNFGIALLNPLVISIGMLLGIPINAAIDIVFRQMPATKQFIVGGVLIIVSFVLCTIPIREIGAFAKRKQEAHDDEQQ